MTTVQLVIGAVVCLGITFTAAAIGAQFMPDDWYRNLAKPSWNPRDWIFAPVWTVLYLMMATSAWLVWREHGIAAAAFPLGLYVFQLILNGVWSWLFFGLHRPDLAFLDIGLMWPAILATLIFFWRLEPLAGALLVPYLAWVSFAGALNWTIWRMNR